jgi:hypothetical protein
MGHPGSTKAFRTKEQENTDLKIGQFTKDEFRQILAARGERTFPEWMLGLQHSRGKVREHKIHKINIIYLNDISREEYGLLLAKKEQGKSWKQFVLDLSKGSSK